jgi:heme o synthase
MIKDSISIAKPGIMIGNLISTTGGFFLASRGCVDMSVLPAIVIGTSLVVASACILNNYVDRNLDRIMKRTCNRALVKGIVSQKTAVSWATFLGISGIALLLGATNILSVAIVMAGFGLYVGLYSMYLKRTSVYATLVGSLAGAAPPLAGYCAASSRFDMGAALLLSIYVLWQIPHCYAIGVLRFDDYAAAAIPILPVKRGMSAARKHMIGHILAFVAAASMLTFCGYTGYCYLLVVAVLGLSWLHLAWSGYKASDERLWAGRLYKLSILCIFALSIMMSIDVTAPAGSSVLLTHGR